MKNPELKNLLVDPDFAAELNAKQASWRRIVSLCVASGIAAPAFSCSLGYFDSYRRARLPANLTQVPTHTGYGNATGVKSVCCQAQQRTFHIPVLSFNSPNVSDWPCVCQQAQRDFFGGHTYERIDREGWHHCAWTDSHKDIGDASKRTMGELSHS